MVIFDLIMRTYELMLVLRPDFDTDAKKVSELVGKTAGPEASVKNVSVIGKKNLAYPIRKLAQGIYVLVDLEANALKVAELQRQMGLGNDIIRFLLTLKEE